MSIDSRFHMKLRARLEERRQRVAETMMLGVEEPEYRQSVGYAKALRDILQDCDDVSRDVLKDD